MALGNFSVVVTPERWDRSLDELARLLAPVTGASAASLQGLLSRGRMTIESDLSAAAAARLLARMEAMGIPATLETDASDDLAKTIADRPDIDDMLASLGIDDIDITDGFENVQNAPTREVKAPGERTTAVGLTTSEAETLGEERSTAIGLPAAGGRKIPAPIPKPDIKSTVHGFGAWGEDVDTVLREARDIPEAPKDENEGWGAVFPELDASEADRTTLNLVEISEAEPRSTNSWHTIGVLEGEPLDLDSGFHPQPIDPGPGPEATSEPVVVQEPINLDPTPVRPPPAQPPSRGVDADVSARPEDNHAATRLDATLYTEKEAPPYAPSGFDPRPDHSPQLAKLLSVVAPGAGQVYNGDSDEALAYGFKFILVLPWITSVRKAESRAKRIATHFAPRPEDGSLFRAVRYAVLWWVAVISVVFLVVWFGTQLNDSLNREPVPEFTEADVRRSIQDAELKVTTARIAGLDALAEAMARSPRQRFSLSKKERAERLFRVGYQYCESKQFRPCEDTMRKVTQLDPSNRDAFRLQAWASIRRRSAHDRTAMPDVGVVESLQALELQELQESELKENPDAP